MIKYLSRGFYRNLRRSVLFSLGLMVSCECWYVCRRVGGNLTSLRCHSGVAFEQFFIRSGWWCGQPRACSVTPLFNRYVATLHPGKSLVEVCNFYNPDLTQTPTLPPSTPKDVPSTLALLPSIPHFHRLLPYFRRHICLPWLDYDTSEI